MAEKTDKWVETVAKLVRLTQEGAIIWESSPPPKHLTTGAEDYVEATFITVYLDRRLRLYRRLFKYDVDPLLGFIPENFRVNTPTIKQKWAASKVLEFIDPDGNSLWTFPEVAPLGDLLEKVRYQVAGVKEFVEHLFSEPYAEESESTEEQE